MAAAKEQLFGKHRPRDRRLADVGADGEALLREVLASPDDDRPRLVYADYLQQRGDPRGEFIAVQCAHAKLPEGDARAEPLAARAQALLGKHQREWVNPFMGDRHTLVIGGRKYTRTPPSQWDFHRGFVRTATVSAESFPELSAGLFAREPVRRVRLTNRGLEPVLEARGLEKLRELDLSHMRLKDEAIALFNCKRFESLEVLELKKCALGVKGAKAMAGADPQRWPQLRHLGLAECALKDAALRELGRSPLLTRVRSLDLFNNKFGVAGWTSFVASPWLERVEVLDVNYATIGAEGARALAASKLCKTLQVLKLRYVQLGDEGLAELARAAFTALRELRVPLNGLTDRAVELLKGGWVDRLEVLDLSENSEHWDPVNHLSASALEKLRKRFGARLILD